LPPWFVVIIIIITTTTTTAIQLSLSGSSSYTSTDKTNKNIYQTNNKYKQTRMNTNK